MSAIEQREEIIFDNIPKLIKCLTNFENNEENFKRCEEFAVYTIKNHKSISVNSHDIKRQIEGMKEKFIFENYKLYADHLQKLCNGIINHPLCINHYEVDVHWAIIDFLFSLSYNPVGSFRKNKHKISLDIIEDIKDDINIEQDYWTKILKEDFAPLERNVNEEDSDLSDWSDNTPDDDIITVQDPIDKTTISNENKIPKPICIIPGVKLSPPKKPLNYTLFDASQSKTWLYQNCQNSWWMNDKSQCEVNSSFESAHFAHLWNSHLADKSNNIIKLENISTEAEYCLMREIIWMFNSPSNCKFFIIDDDGNINVRPNVTIPSVTVNGLKTFLNNSFIPYMKQHNVLRKFMKSIYEYDEILPPKTYECYAASLRDILKPFYVRILEKESVIKKQESTVITTIIQMRKTLDRDFQYLERIYKIHRAVILDFKKYPAHISTAHLLASLLQYFRNSDSVEVSNFCITLFLSCVQIFCNITDAWWTEGRLDDWQQEFLIEKLNDKTEEVILRPYERSKEAAFFVPLDISKCIVNDDFLKIFRNHSIEAGCTLNLLYQINKIGKLRNAYKFDGNLYDTFIAEVLKSISEFHSDRKTNISNYQNYIFAEDSIYCDKNSDDKNLNTKNHYSMRKFLAECSSMNDEFLLMAFTCNLDLEEILKEDEQELEPTEDECKSNDSGIRKDDSIPLSKPLEILQILNNTASIVLPLEEIILRSIARILKTRISFANNFVINMYRNEFQISKHLQNIRKVLLLESSDLLNYFYVKIFTEIELGKQWANPFALTVQLDDLMTSKYPDVSSLFRVEISSSYKCQTTKVVEAVDEITIYYNAKKELQNIISDQSLNDYNKVFRFLLKVKWGLWTLENLNFPECHKNRIPYAQLEMIDLYMRRLEQLRFWMIYSIQCIHFHLMTHVLQSMGEQLDKKIENCLNLTEMKSVHKSYISTICEHCFLTESSQDIKVGVIQLLNLIYVLRVEWNNCVREIENNFVLNDTDEDDDEQTSNYILSSQIEAIEHTYIRCHQYLAKTLNTEVYVKQNSFLSGLSAAFNTSIPY